MNFVASVKNVLSTYEHDIIGKAHTVFDELRALISAAEAEAKSEVSVVETEIKHVEAEFEAWV